VATFVATPDAQAGEVIVSVTALGSRTGDAAGAAAGVVDYLDGNRPEQAGTQPGPTPELPAPQLRALGGTRVVTGYYADSVEGPGHWLGRGLAGVNLTGQVDAADLLRVLQGQHPGTGTHLVAAHGSAGRAERAGRDHARVPRDGTADELLSLAEAASLLVADVAGVSRSAIVAMSSSAQATGVSARASTAGRASSRSSRSPSSMATPEPLHGSPDHGVGRQTGIGLAVAWSRPVRVVRTLRKVPSARCPSNGGGVAPSPSGEPQIWGRFPW